MVFPLSSLIDTLGSFFRVFWLHNDPVRKACQLIFTFLHGLSLDDVAKLDFSGHLRELLGLYRGRHSARTWPLLTRCPCSIFSLAPVNNMVFSRSLPVSSSMAISPFRFITTGTPSLLRIVLPLRSFTYPSLRASRVDCSTLLEAAPPIWKVLMVRLGAWFTD